MCSLKTSESIHKNCACQFAHLCKRHQLRDSEQDNFYSRPAKESLFYSNIVPLSLSHVIIDKDINKQGYEPLIKITG